MNRYNRFFESKFKGCLLLATQQDEGRGLEQRLYYIGEQTLVGVYDGIDTWISPITKCFTGLKEGYLAEQIKRASEGKIAVGVTERKKLVVAPVRKILLTRSPTYVN